MTQNMAVGQDLPRRHAHAVAAARAVDSNGSRQRSEYSGFDRGSVPVCRRACGPGWAARAALTRGFGRLTMVVVVMVVAD